MPSTSIAMLFNWMNKLLTKNPQVRDTKRKLHKGKVHNATLLQFRHFKHDPDRNPSWPQCPSKNNALSKSTQPISHFRGTFHERLEQSDDDANNNLTSEICKETEILNYINHLDEAATFVPESISSREGISHDNSNSTRDSFGSIVEDTLSRRSCHRRDYLDLIRMNPEVIDEMRSEDAQLLKLISSSGGTRDEGALRKALWKSVDVIFENYGLEFLEIVSTSLMLTKRLHKRQRGSKVKRLKKTQCTCTSCNSRTGPKFIVMVDDPPCHLLANKADTIARLLMIELYLLGVKMFVLPCYDLPPRILGSLLDELKEDGRHPHSDAAYGFLLQIGFALILQRDSADVILFDGDWSSVDVSGLIATAERGGHELIFMKNHEGIQKAKFAQLVAARIHTRMKNTSQDRSPSLSTTSDQTSEEEDDSGSPELIPEELQSVTSGEGAVQSSELEDFNNNRPQCSGRHCRSRKSPYSVRAAEPCRVKSRERPRTAHYLDAKAFGKSESSDVMDDSHGDDQNLRQLRRVKSWT